MISEMLTSGNLPTRGVFADMLAFLKNRITSLDLMPKLVFSGITPEDFVEGGTP
jgi:hypothetical protein